MNGRVRPSHVPSLPCQSRARQPGTPSLLPGYIGAQAGSVAGTEAGAGIEDMFSKMSQDPEHYLTIAGEYGVRFPDSDS